MQQPKILVAIRKRPLSKKEAAKGETDIVTVKSRDTVIVSEYKQKVDLTKFLEETIFNFDFAFNEETNNEQIYQCAVRPLVDSAFQGAKVTCFAYGQTGSGKTYTMNGNMNQGVPGLYTLGANDIFAYLSHPNFQKLKAKLSFYEIYCGKLFDLLNKRAELKLREDNKNNINIIGLEEASINSPEEFIQYLSMGSQMRVTSQNSANADSSRSHAILQISIKQGKKLHGKISFIDLAGNERGADHMDMDKQTRIDGAQINKSLLSLKECIRALDQGKGHTPFRGSKLTMVLKDSFVGFCRTVMIGNVSPSSASSQNTLNTLRYADRVKQLRKPQQGSTKEQLKAKEMMLPRQNKNAIRIMINNDDDAEDIARKRDEAQKEYGIAEQIPKKREDSFVRKNEVKNSGGLIKQEGMKSSSVAKNYSTNSLGTKPMMNNLVNQSNFRDKNVKFQKKHEADEFESKLDNPQLLRFKSATQNLLERREQPMDIQGPSQTPYYLLNNNKNIQHSSLFANNNSNSFHQQIGANQGQRQSNTPNQNLSNYSQLQQNSSSRLGVKKTISSQHQFFVQSPPNNLVTRNQPPTKAFGNNYQNNYNQNHQLYGSRHQQHQNPQISQNWQDMVAIVSNSTDPQFNEKILAEMNERLFAQESQLMQDHSQTLKKQIDTIKAQMSLINELEIDRNKITIKQYVLFMQENIEQKISNLQSLRQSLNNFRYKLDTMEEIENMETCMKGVDDEQLLDDIN